MSDGQMNTEYGPVPEGVDMVQVLWRGEREFLEPVGDYFAVGQLLAFGAEQVAAANARVADLLQVLRMVDDNHRVDDGEDRKAWRHAFVVAEVRRALGDDAGLHFSDCATNNGPAYPAGPCDCGVAK